MGVLARLRQKRLQRKQKRANVNVNKKVDLDWV